MPNNIAGVDFSTPTPNQKERIMRSLGVSAETAEEILQCDKAIDRGERVYFDLDPNAEKLARRYARKPIVLEQKPRKRAPNEQKIAIVNEIHSFLNEKYENCEILNPNRLISLTFGGKTYEIAIIEKRAT